MKDILNVYYKLSHELVPYYLRTYLETIHTTPVIRLPHQITHQHLIKYDYAACSLMFLAIS